MSHRSTGHRPALLCLLLVTLCSKVVHTASTSNNTQGRKLLSQSSGSAGRALQQDSEIEDSTSSGLWQQPGDLTDDLLQPGSADSATAASSGGDSSSETQETSDQLTTSTTSSDSADPQSEDASSSASTLASQNLEPDASAADSQSSTSQDSTFSATGADALGLASLDSEQESLISSSSQNADSSSSTGQYSDSTSLGLADADSVATQSDSEPESTSTQDSDLTFDQALQRATADSELSDQSDSNLTFAEALAARRAADSSSGQSSASTSDPLQEVSVLESGLPEYDSLGDTLTSALTETASNVSATAGRNADSSISSSSSSSGGGNDAGVLSGLVDGSAVESVRQGLSHVANTSGGLLQQGASAVTTNSSAVNATRGIISGAASTAAGLLTNATSALSTAANSSASGALSAASSFVSNATNALTTSSNSQTLNSSHRAGSHAAAGGLESDSALPTNVLNSSMSGDALRSSAQRGSAGALLNATSTQQDAEGDDSLGGTDPDHLLRHDHHDDLVGHPELPAWNHDIRTSAAEDEVESVDSAHVDHFLRHDHHDDLVGHPELTGTSQDQIELPLDLDDELAADEYKGLSAAANLSRTASQRGSSSATSTGRGSDSGTSPRGSSRPAYNTVAGRTAAQRPRTATQSSSLQTADASDQAADLDALSTLSVGSQAQQAGRQQQPSDALADEYGDDDLSAVDGVSAGRLDRSGGSGTRPSLQDSRQQLSSGGRGSTTAGNGTGAVTSRSRTGSASTDPAVATSRAESGSRSSSASRASALSRAVDDEEEGDSDGALGGLVSDGGSSNATPRGQIRGSSSAVSAQQLAEERQEEEVMQRLQDMSTGTTRSSSQSARPKYGSTTASTTRPTRSTGSQTSSDALSSARMAELDDEYDDNRPVTGRSSDRSAGAESARGSDSGMAGRASSPRSGTARATSLDNDYILDNEEYDDVTGRGSNSGSAFDARLREHASDLDDDYTSSSSASRWSPSGTTALRGSSSSSSQLPRQTSAQTGGSSGFDDEIIREYEADSSRSQDAVSVPIRQAGRTRSPASRATPGSSRSGSTGSDATSGRGSRLADAQGQLLGARGSEYDTDLDNQQTFQSLSQSNDDLYGRQSSRDTDSELASSDESDQYLSASDTRTPAQQRELEREMAFRASTGGSAHALPSERASGNALGARQDSRAGSNLPLSSQEQDDSWGLSSSGGNAASGNRGFNSRQQSLSGGESEDAIGAYDPRSNFGLSEGGSSSSSSSSRMNQANGLRARSNALGTSSSRGEEQDQDSQGFGIVSDLNSQQTSADLDSSTTGTQTGVTAGNTKMSLDTEEDEEAPLLAGSHSSSSLGTNQKELTALQRAQNGLAGPVVPGDDDDTGIWSQKAASRPSQRESSSVHSFLNTVLDRWVAVTALTVFACTGAVAAFVFLRGMVRNPYEAISVSNVGTGGYAGNNGYAGVHGEDEESGWENGWDEDNDAEVVSPQQPRSSSNSPPRGTGVGKLKKGSFAKKKSTNWSNDF